MKSEDKTRLAYWFPLIEAAGIPVPRTTIIEMPKDAQECVWSAFDGKDGKKPEVMAAFVAEIAAAASKYGYPFFLRTDHTSGKHDWDNTCFVKAAADIPRHISGIAEYSEMAGLIGLPWDVWAVREFLPTIPVGICPRYGNMPLCREFRFFVDDGEIRCWHPYWPMESFEQGGADTSLYDQLSQPPADYDAVADIVRKAGRAVGGSWSIDVLETRKGWFVTDMAEAHKSFHWEGCESQEAVR